MQQPTITAIPIFENNYVWIIKPDPVAAFVYIVDPGEAGPVINYLHHHQVTPAAILITHRHKDHIGGVSEIANRWPIPVYGPDSPAIPQVTHKLKAGDTLFIGDWRAEVIAVPGHTSEHIAYFMRLNSSSEVDLAPALFCGDALFAGGCGRMFDGPADLMWNSLCKLAALPDNTRIFCAHEYTLANLAFALVVEPENLAIRERLTLTRAQRAQGQITLPSTISEEKRTNPFLRCHLPGAKSFAYSGNDENLTAAQIFASLRRIKDDWQG